MEMVALQSEQQLPRQTLARNESVAAVDEIQGSPSPCHQVDGGDSRDGETSGYSIPFLPEEKTTLSELEKTFSEKIANAEESPKMEQDDKSIHILRKSIGSFLGGDADDQFGQDDD